LYKNDIIDLLWNINTGQFEDLKRKIQSKTDALNWLLREIKKKESHLRSLDNRLGIIPMTQTTNDLTYRPSNMYPPLPDGTSIRTQSSKIRLSDINYDVIDGWAIDIVDKWIDNVGIS
jgi:nitrogen fixation-related uncharacterized protein